MSKNIKSFAENMIYNRIQITIFRNDLKSKSNHFTKWQIILVSVERLSACIIILKIFKYFQNNKLIFMAFYTVYLKKDGNAKTAVVCLACA
jgi:hypothetical protein